MCIRDRPKQLVQNKLKAQEPFAKTKQILFKNNSLFLLHGYRLSNDQVITQSTQADKSLLTATVKDTNKLRAFLRGLGDNIEVIAPQKLRQYFAELSERLYFAYQEKAVQNNQMFTD